MHAANSVIYGGHSVSRLGVTKAGRGVESPFLLIKIRKENTL